MDKENFAEKTVLKEKIEGNDTFIEKVVREISQNHRKIIDDWCKAYLAHLYEEGVEIKPNCFTLFHKQPSGIKEGQEGYMVHEYWFEPRDKQETANEKLLKEVMGRLSNLIKCVDDKLLQLRGKSGNEELKALLFEINGFLNFVDREEINDS